MLVCVIGLVYVGKLWLFLLFVFVGLFGIMRNEVCLLKYFILFVILFIIIFSLDLNLKIFILYSSISYFVNLVLYLWICYVDM